MPRRHLAQFALLVCLAVVLLRTASPQVAFGQLIPGAPTTTVETVSFPEVISRAISKAYNAAKEKLKTATDIAFKNGTRIFLATATRELAVSLATTQPGQKPLFLTKPLTFFTDVGDAAAGDFIDDFTRGLTGASFDQRNGVTGGTTAPGELFDNQQNKFIISRILREASDATGGGQCHSTCQKKFGVGSVTVVKKPENTGNFSSIKGNNDHERAVAQLRGWIEVAGGTRALQQQNAKQPIVCHDIQQNPTDQTWHFAFGACDEKVGTPGPECTMTANDCLQNQLQAINIEIGDASEEVKNCNQGCLDGTAANATRQAIHTATATDVFAAAREINTSNAPTDIANALSNEASGIGQFFSATALLTATVQTKILGEQTRLTAGVLPRTSKVSDEVLAPKEAGSALFGIPFYNNNGELTYTGTGAADILRGVASFINSPVGKALTTYFKSKCGLNPDACKGPSNPQSEIGKILFGNGGQTGIAGARLQYATLGQADIITGDPGRNEVNVTDQLTTSGLIDAQFRTAIDENLTVQQALDRRLLDGQKTFGFDKNGVEPTNGYPFRALQYLRKFRVTPVGWELAAKYSQQFHPQDLSLGFLVSQFNMCGQEQSFCSNDTSKICAKNADCSGGTCQLAEGQTTHKVCSASLKSCTIDTECTGVGETCGASPYCGLVDPNWVLKAPQTYCRRQGAGEEIVTKEFVCDLNNIDKATGKTISSGQTCSAQSSTTGSGATCSDVDAPNCVASDTNPNPDTGHWVIQRNTDTCADTQSCIAENDDGTCKAFGYCVQERQTFKFDGTQCQAQNASCTTYTTPKGQNVSYLANTIDSRNCNSDNAGCQWYCQAPSFNTTTKQWTCTDSAGSKINLTAKSQSCPSGQAGCHEFIRTGNNTNLLPNSGFETYDGGAVDTAPALFTGWSNASSISMIPTVADDSAVTASNQTAVKISTSDSNALVSQTIDTGYALYERTFTFSLRAKASGTCAARLSVCAGGSCTSAGLPANMNLTDQWQSFSATTAIGSQNAGAVGGTKMTVEVNAKGCGTQGFVIDSAQLEEDAGPTAYHPYASINKVYMNDTRLACTAADVGCEKYTPQAGGAAVTAIARNGDHCSATSVGCDLYHQEAITSLPNRPGADVNVVAPRGQQCSAADVGCEEYTNLDQARNGGESKAYYKSVKQCVKPTNTQVTKQTYYTWVGDSQKGFVLRSYDLVTTNLTDPAHQGAPCTHLGVGSTSADPKCEDTVSLADAASCSAGDLAGNPDCAQYYDSALHIFYRLRSKTVSVTDDCHPFRNTIDGDSLVYYLSPQENISCSAAAAGCRAYTGNAAKTSHVLMTEEFEKNGTANWTGGTLDAASVQFGGHSMKITATGATGSAYTVKSVLEQKLARGKSYVVSFTAAAANTTSSTKVKVFLAAPDGTGALSTSDALAFQPTSGGAAATWNTNITPSGPEWHTYTLGPIKLDRDPNPDWRLGFVTEGGDSVVDHISLTEINDSLYLVASTVPQCAAADVGCSDYRDRAGEHQYLKSFSRICSDRVVGCEAMIDTKNSTSPFTQTVKNVTTDADSIVTVVNNPATYCAAAYKGCQALGQPKYIRDNAISGFNTVYKKVDPDRYAGDLCTDGTNGTANELFCQAYQTTDGTAAFFKDPMAQTCEFQNDSTGGRWVITGTSTTCPTVTPPSLGRPIGASCSMYCGSGDRAGKTCTSDSECPKASSGNACLGNRSTVGKTKLANGSFAIGQCNSDADCGLNTCVYAVGSCPSAENSCTEYRDPTDPISCRSACPLQLQGASPVYVDASCAKTVCKSNTSTAGAHEGQNCRNSEQCGSGSSCVGTDAATPTIGAPGCRPYYYLRQSVEDTAADCNGQVDASLGCRPFNDTSNPALNFRGQ